VQAVHYQFTQNGRTLNEGVIEAPFTVGRQAERDEPGPVSVYEIASDKLAGNFDAPRKLIVVPLSKISLPRLAALVTVDRNDTIVVRNIHRVIEISLATGQRIAPNSQCVIGSDGILCLPEQFQLRVSLNDISESPFKRRDAHSIIELNSSIATDELEEDSHLLSLISDDGKSGQEIAVQLVRTALFAFQQAPGSEEFFSATGESAIRMIDLDRVAVLTKRDSAWTPRAISFRPGSDETALRRRGFSQSLLAKMEQTVKTMIVEPQINQLSMGLSMQDLDRAVASPIIDDGKVVGALYGDRALGGETGNKPIGELEASLLEVLARGISASLTIEREQRMRNSMTQFFSPVILSQLQRDTRLLESKEVEVSVLFCDIRGFSAVTERIGPAKAIGWINDVLSELSACVLEFDGVLVDYIGDELMAMWGAPVDQPDHAQRACQAAHKMLSCIQPLEQIWKNSLTNYFSVGIGINSGPACVGNTGSKQKFKYGPIGNTVNVASRVQGVTKQLGITSIVTAETARAATAIDSRLQTRRLATAKVVGIVKPIQLYQLCEPGTSADLCQRYEIALTAFESGNLKDAAGHLAGLVQQYPDDRPTIILLSRTVEQLTMPTTEFDPIWHLVRK
jgi:adenylate cyclase